MVRQAHHERVMEIRNLQGQGFSLASRRANTPLILSLSKDKLVVRQAHHEQVMEIRNLQGQGFSLASRRANTPLILSLSKDKRVVRQAHHERVIETPCRVMEIRNLQGQGLFPCKLLGKYSAHPELVEGLTGGSTSSPWETRQPRLNQGNPSNRRSGESRNPGNPTGKERAG